MRTRLSPSKETIEMRFVSRALAALAIGTVGALALAGVYAETHRVPDQS
jgi:hypothetical protein